MDDRELHYLADLCLEARGELEGDPRNPLRILLDMALFEVGRQIAASSAPMPEPAFAARSDAAVLH
jgi:hypothetical protein